MSQQNTHVNGTSIVNRYKDIASISPIENRDVDIIKMTFSNDSIGEVEGREPIQQIKLSTAIMRGATARDNVVINGVYTPNDSNSLLKHVVASKDYVDTKVAASDLGINWKNAVAVRTTPPVGQLDGDLGGSISGPGAGSTTESSCVYNLSDIALGGRATLRGYDEDSILGGLGAGGGVGKELTDGVALSALTNGQPTRILVMNQHAASQNGIYEIVSLGYATDSINNAPGTPWKLVRARDAEGLVGSSDIKRAAVFIDGGERYYGRGYVESGNWGDTDIVGGDPDDSTHRDIEFSLMATISETITTDGLSMDGRYMKVNVDTVGVAGHGTMKIENDMITVNKLHPANFQGNAVDSAALAQGSVDSERAVGPGHIKDNAVEARTIAGGAVGHTQLASRTDAQNKNDERAVKTDHIQTGAVTTFKIASRNITTDLIANTNVTLEKMAINSVDSSKIVDESIIGTDIADNTITLGNMAVGSVDNTKIVANSITKGQIAESTITNTEIANSTIQTEQLSNNCVKKEQIDGDAVNGDKIADDSIDSEHYVDGSIDSVHLAGNIGHNNPGDGTRAVKKYNIADLAVTSRAVADEAVTTTKIKPLNITNGLIADADIGLGKLAAQSVDTGNIVNNCITKDQIKAGTITNAEIDAGAVTSTELQSQNTPSAGSDSSAFLLNDNNRAVGEHHIKTGAVTSSKIADESINSEHYVNGSIDSAHLAGTTGVDADEPNDLTRAVKTSNIADAAVTRRTIASDAVDGTKIANNSIDSEHYAAASIDSAHLAGIELTGDAAADLGKTRAVETLNISDAAVDNRCLAPNAVKNDKIHSRTIQADRLIEGCVTNFEIAAGTVIGYQKISTKSIRGSGIDGQISQIADNTIAVEQLATGSVTTTILQSEIMPLAPFTPVELAATDANRAVSGDHIKTGAITGGELANGSKIGYQTITNANIATDAISGEKIQNNAITSLKIAHGAINENHCIFNNLTVAATIHAQGIILGGDSSGVGTTDLAKVKSIAITFDVPSPQKLFLSQRLTGSSVYGRFENAIGWWATHPAISAGGPTSLLELCAAHPDEDDNSTTTTLSDLDSLSKYVGDNPSSSYHGAGIDADNPLYTNVGLYAAGWSLPSTGTDGTVANPGTDTSNAIVGGMEVNVDSMVPAERYHGGMLKFAKDDRVRGVLVMWGLMVRTAGLQPATITAKTYLAKNRYSDDNVYVPQLLSTQTIHTDISAGSTNSIVHTKLTEQTTFIDVTTAAGPGADSGIYIDKIWVELTFEREQAPGTITRGSNSVNTKVIIPNETVFSLLGLIISDGSTANSETMAGGELGGTNSMLLDATDNRWTGAALLGGLLT